MADGRMLKKVVSTSRKLARLKSDSCRLLYTWILPHLDVEGRIHADADIIKGTVVPRLKTMTLPKIEAYLKELHSEQLIVLYRVNGDTFLQLVKFDDFQNLRKDREAESIIPPPPDELLAGLRQDDSGSAPAQVILSEDKISQDILLIFDKARLKYPGVKRGLETELENFQKHDDWKQSLPLLESAILKQIETKKLLKQAGKFCAGWKHFENWINARSWEESSPSDTPPKPIVYCPKCAFPKSDCQCKEAK